MIISCSLLLWQRLVSGLGHGPGRAVALALQSEAVGAVSEPVEGGGAEQSVGEGVAPLGEVEVGGDDGGAAFVALGDDRRRVSRVNQISPVVWGGRLGMEGIMLRSSQCCGRVDSRTERGSHSGVLARAAQACR